MTTQTKKLKLTAEKPISLCVFYYLYDQLLDYHLELDNVPKYEKLLSNHISAESIQYKIAEYSYDEDDLEGFCYKKSLIYHYNY